MARNIAYGAQNVNTSHGAPLFNANHLHYHENNSRCKPTHNIPYIRNDDFIARPNIDLELKPGTRTALHGIGGIGKSQLAIDYCYQSLSPDVWTFWIHASTAARFDEGVRTLAQVAGISHDNTNLYRCVHAWLTHNDWLIVLDNVDDIDHVLERVEDRPRIDHIATQGTLLITTRRESVAKQLAGRVVKVEAEKEHGETLLRTKLQHQLGVEELAAALDYVPLAIIHAAAYLNRPGSCSVATYIRKLSDDGLYFNLVDLHQDIQETKRSVLASWRLSFERLPPSAADLLSLMSFHDNKGIPISLLRDYVELWSNDQTINDKRGHEHVQSRRHLFSSVLATAVYLLKRPEPIAHFNVASLTSDLVTLCDFSLVTATAQSTFGVHRLVQLATQVWLRERHASHDWKLLSLRSMSRLIPSGANDSREWLPAMARLYTQMKSLISLDTGCHEGDTLLYMLMDHALGYEAVRFQLADVRSTGECMTKLAARIDPNWFRHYDPASLVWCTSFSEQHHSKDVELDCELRSRVTSCTQVLDPGHPETFNATKNLIYYLYTHKDWSECIRLLEDLIPRHERTFGLDHDNTLWAKAMLADCRSREGPREDATQLIDEILALVQRSPGRNPPVLAAIKSSCARVLVRNSEFARAEAMLLQHRDDKRFDPCMIVCFYDWIVSDLLVAYNRSGNYQRAIALLIRSLVELQDRLDPTHFWMAEARIKLIEYAAVLALRNEQTQQHDDLLELTRSLRCQDSLNHERAFTI